VFKTPLSNKQEQVLESLIKHRGSTKEALKELNISRSTYITHLCDIKDKMINRTGHIAGILVEYAIIRERKLLAEKIHNYMRNK